MGQLQYQCMVCKALTQSLLLQSLFCAQNSGISYLWLCQAVPPTLSGTVFDVKQSFAGGHWQTCDNITRYVAKETDTCTYACQEEAIIGPHARPQTKPYRPCPCMAPSTRRSAKHTILPPARTKGTRSMEQRVEQRVADLPLDNIPALNWISNSPPIMTAPNPTAKCILKLTKRPHSRHRGNNILGSMPPIKKLRHVSMAISPNQLLPSLSLNIVHRKPRHQWHKWLQHKYCKSASSPSMEDCNKTT